MSQPRARSGIRPRDERPQNRALPRDTQSSEHRTLNRDIVQLRKLVVSALRRLTNRNDPEYEDLVQIALLGVIARSQSDASGLDYSPHWAGRIARALTIDRLRARARELRVLESAGDVDRVATESSSSPEHVTAIREQLQRLDSGLSKLSKGHGSVIHLHDVLGYKLNEIAETLDISVAAAQSRLVRGRRALLNWLETGER